MEFPEASTLVHSVSQVHGPCTQWVFNPYLLTKWVIFTGFVRLEERKFCFKDKETGPGRFGNLPTAVWSASGQP